MILPVAMNVPKRVVIGLHLILTECFHDVKNAKSDVDRVREKNGGYMIDIIEIDRSCRCVKKFNGLGVRI
jgi:hypothetical protein